MFWIQLNAVLSFGFCSHPLFSKHLTHSDTVFSATNFSLLVSGGLYNVDTVNTLQAKSPHQRHPPLIAIIAIAIITIITIIAIIGGDQKNGKKILYFMVNRIL